MPRNNLFFTYGPLKFLSTKELFSFLLVEKESLVYVVKLCIKEYDELVNEIRHFVDIEKLPAKAFSDILVMQLNDLPKAEHALSSYDKPLNILINIKYINDILHGFNKRISLDENYAVTQNQLLDLPNQLNGINQDDLDELALITGQAKKNMRAIGLLSFLQQLAEYDSEQKHRFLTDLLDQEPDACILVLYMQQYITSAQKFNDYYELNCQLQASGLNIDLLFDEDLAYFFDPITLPQFNPYLDLDQINDFAVFMRQLRKNPGAVNIFLLRLLPFLLSAEIVNYDQLELKLIIDQRLCRWWELLSAVNGDYESALMVLGYADALLYLFCGPEKVCTFVQFVNLSRLSSNPRQVFFDWCYNQESFRAALVGNNRICDFPELSALMAGDGKMADIVFLADDLERNNLEKLFKLVRGKLCTFAQFAHLTGGGYQRAEFLLDNLEGLLNVFVGDERMFIVSELMDVLDLEPTPDNTSDSLLLHQDKFIDFFAGPEQFQQWVNSDDDITKLLLSKIGKLAPLMMGDPLLCTFAQIQDLAGDNLEMANLLLENADLLAKLLDNHVCTCAQLKRMVGDNVDLMFEVFVETDTLIDLVGDDKECTVAELTNIIKHDTDDESEEVGRFHFLLSAENRNQFTNSLNKYKRKLRFK